MFGNVVEKFWVGLYGDGMYIIVGILKSFFCICGCGDVFWELVLGKVFEVYVVIVDGLICGVVLEKESDVYVGFILG